MNRFIMAIAIAVAFLAQASVAQDIIEVEPTSPPTVIGNRFVAIGNVANFGILAKRKTILRFQATESGSIQQFNWWWRANVAGFVNPPDRWSYSAGTGGRYLVTLQGDSTDGKPDGVELDRFRFVPDLENFPPRGPRGANNSFRPSLFERNVTIEKGSIYNLVFENVDPDPWKNYVSLNGTFSRNLDYNFDFGFEINELHESGLFRRNSGSLTYLPAWAITMTDGKQIGQAFQYGDYWTGQHAITGSNLVEQVIEVTEDCKIANLNVHATRLHGNGALVANLFVDRKWIKTISFESKKFPQLALVQAEDLVSYSGLKDYESYAWAKARADVEIKAGQVLRVRFSTAHHSRYYVPGAVHAGGYTGINARALGASVGARYSSDGGVTWQNWKLRSGQHTTGITLSVFATIAGE